MKIKTRNDWLFIVTIFLIAFFLDIFILKEILKLAFPLGDEFSLIAESLKPSLSWISTGYKEYFIVYSEYTVPFTNFIRPVANIIYFLFSYSNNQYISQLIFINYLIHSLICALLFYISNDLGNSRKFSATSALIAFFIPAFWLSPMVSYPSFSLDAIATFLCTLSLILINKDKKFWGFLLLILSLFTKESTLPVIVSIIIFGFITKRTQLIIYSILILTFWIFLRKLTYGPVYSGAYSFNEFSILTFIQRLGSAVTLPLGNFAIADLRKLLFDKNISISVIYLLSNLTAWFLTLFLIYKNISLLKSKNGFLLIFVISTACSVAFYIVIGGDTRFTYLPAIFWLVVLMAFPNSKTRNIIVVMMVLSSFLSFILRPNYITESTKFQYVAAKKLVEFLNTNNISGEVYLFNDFFINFSKDINFAKFSKSNVELFRGSSISIGGCNSNYLNLIKTTLINNDSSVKRLKVTLPQCAHFQFEGVSDEKLLSNFNGDILYRNSQISYQFKDMIIGLTRITKKPLIAHYGRQIEIIISNSPIIYFDFENNSWIYVN
jgi:hypothetical protein